MTQEKINYKDYTLDPTKDVLVNPTIIVELQRFVTAVKQNHTEFKFDQQTTWFNKETHKPVDSSKKISQEKLNSDYYQSVNIETTEDKGKVVFDELSLSAIKLLAAFEEVFRHNVDKGNCMLIPEMTPTPAVVETPGSTLVKDEG